MILASASFKTSSRSLFQANATSEKLSELINSTISFMRSSRLGIVNSTATRPSDSAAMIWRKRSGLRGISLTCWFVRYIKCYDKCHKEGVYIVRMGVVNLFKSPLSRLHEKSCATGLRLTSKILHSEELPYIGIMEDLFRKHLLCSYCQRILVLGCVPLRAMLTLPFSTSYSFAISSG